jgi:hypothetical protein
MLHVTAIVHPATDTTTQAAAGSPDAFTNVAVLLAAGLLVVVLVRLLRVVTVVVSALVTVFAALGGVVFMAVAMLAMFALAMGLHTLTGGR